MNEIDCNKSLGWKIPAKIIKMVKEELTVSITNCTNNCISSRTFPDEHEIADIIPVYKKEDLSDKTTHQSVYYQLFQKYWKSFFIHSYKLLPIKYFHQDYVDLEKGILHRMLFLILLKNW